jgi:hypothetical protein
MELKFLRALKLKTFTASFRRASNPRSLVFEAETNLAQPFDEKNLFDRILSEATSPLFVTSFGDFFPSLNREFFGSKKECEQKRENDKWVDLFKVCQANRV